MAAFTRRVFVAMQRLRAMYLAKYILKQRQTVSTSARIWNSKSVNGVRGEDFYGSGRLTKALTKAILKFRMAHGSYPDLVNPTGFNEWVVWSKFFRPFRVPESGNKLLTSAFIPKHLTSSICCPQILWSGIELDWPKMKFLREGRRYYLKASHGSGMYKAFRWPLNEIEKKQLTELSGKWLRSSFGLADGEWWYNAFRPSLLIEEDLGGNGFSVNCFCFKGVVGLLVLHSKHTMETITYDHNLILIGQKGGCSDPLALVEIDVLRNIVKLACELSVDVKFARFDFLISDTGRVYLGEVTFTPGNGLSIRPAGVDEMLGQMWSNVERA